MLGVGGCNLICPALVTCFSLSHPQCYNKIDQISLEEVDRLSRQPHSIVTSCEMGGLNLDGLLGRIWDYLALLRVYTKKRGGESERLTRCHAILPKG